MTNFNILFFQLYVEEARGVEDNNHPQWNFSGDEGGNNPTVTDGEFATESDSDN